MSSFTFYYSIKVRKNIFDHLLQYIKRDLINASYSGEVKIQIVKEKNIFLSFQMALNLP